MVLGKRKRPARPGMARRTRRRATRARTTSRSMLSTIANRQVYPFKRFVGYKVTLVGNDAVPGVLGGVAFTFNDLPSPTEFSNLFDQYKLVGVAYRWVVNKDPMLSNTSTAATRLYPRICWVHDYDDNNTPGALTDIYQYPKMKEFYFSETHPQTKWYYIKPAKANVGYEGATNSWYSPDWKSWVDMASTNVPHYGIKYGTEGQFAGININLQTRYYFLCKNVR